MVTGDVLRSLRPFVGTVPQEAYASQADEARRRLRRRDESDWPYLALALTVDCPIWTEDQDFFGCGVATRTTDRVEFYLSPYA
jgi:predicted nucleic acid-binding protein